MFEKIKIKEIKLPLFILAFSVVTVVAEVLRELSDFCVRRYEVKTDKTEETVKFVFLSDLHGKVYGEDNCKLVRAVKREKPDLILVGGDMLTRSKVEADETAFRLMAQLKEIAPVYLANGNHEQKLKEYTEDYDDRYIAYKEKLEDAGIIFLENDCCDIEVKGLPMTITGLEVPVKCYTHFKTVPLSNEEITDRIGEADASRYQILMAHTPTYMKEYKEWGADLTLCGHLHGGIIRLPFIGGMITPQVELFPRYSGDMYKDGEHYSIVSRGLGTHTVNLRYLNMAELVSVTINPQ